MTEIGLAMTELFKRRGCCFPYLSHSGHWNVDFDGQVRPQGEESVIQTWEFLNMKLYECVMGLLRIAEGIFRNGHWKLLSLCTKKSAPFSMAFNVSRDLFPVPSHYGAGYNS